MRLGARLQRSGAPFAAGRRCQRRGAPVAQRDPAAAGREGDIVRCARRRGDAAAERRCRRPVSRRRPRRQASPTAAAGPVYGEVVRRRRHPERSHRSPGVRVERHGPLGALGGHPRAGRGRRAARTRRRAATRRRQLGTGSARRRPAGRRIRSRARHCGEAQRGARRDGEDRWAPRRAGRPSTALHRRGSRRGQRPRGRRARACPGGRDVTEAADDDGSAAGAGRSGAPPKAADAEAAATTAKPPHAAAGPRRAALRPPGSRCIAEAYFAHAHHLPGRGRRARRRPDDGSGELRDGAAGGRPARRASSRTCALREDGRAREDVRRARSSRPGSYGATGSAEPAERRDADDDDGDLDERHQAVQVDALVEAVVRDEPWVG